MFPYPLIFEPLLKEKVWGGQRLANFGKNLPAEINIGESWGIESQPEALEQLVDSFLSGLKDATG